MHMMKRMTSLLLAVIMLSGTVALADWNRDFEWDEQVYRAVYDWKIERRVNGTLTRFYVFYGAPLGEENEPNRFWVSYVPKDAEYEEGRYFVPCAAEDHFLRVTQDGEYMVFIGERTLREAYEYWLESTATPAPAE